MRDLAIVPPFLPPRPAEPRNDEIPNDLLLEIYTQSLAAAARSSRTIENKRYTLAKLARHLQPTPLLYATFPQLLAWQSRTTPLLARGTAAGQVSTVKVFYKWLHRPMRMIAESPAEDLVIPSIPQGKPRPIPERDLQIALKCAATPTMRAWLFLGAYAGLRTVEIAGLQRSGVIDDPEVPRLYVLGKGSKERIVHVGSVIIKLLSPFVDRPGHLFVKPWDGLPYTPRYVSNAISAHFRELGMDHTAHQLRHSYATRALDLTKNIRVVQEQMGHASPATTQLYTLVNEDETRALAKALDAEAAKR